jgi:proteasome accessory factor A
MRERVFGIETEYALIFHPRGTERARPTNLELYRRFEAALLARVRTLPHGFSWLREKGGRFLENGGTFHYEATAEDFEGGLVEMASPECRDPFTLIAHERAKDERVEELCDEVNLQLELAGYRGRARIGKNSVDSQGHTLGSHESYWVEDRLPRWRLALFVPVWLALWLVSLPVVAWLFALRIGLLVTVLGAGTVLLGTGAVLRLIRPALGQRLFAWMESFARDLEQHPGELARRVQRLAAPLYPLMRLHSAVYDRFHFRAIRRDLTAHLVTRTLYTGAGALSFDGGSLFRLAQRPPFLKVLARIFPDDDARPLYEMRDLFFPPWSALRARRRLHLLIGDANMSEWAQALRVGATALALEVIEDGTPEGWPVLAKPLEALQAINVDPELRAKYALCDGSSASALEIQTRILAFVRERLAADPEPLVLWKARVLSMWQETLDGLRRSPDSLADRIDWLAKRRLVIEDLPDMGDREALRQRGAEVMRDGGARTDADHRLRELAFRARRIDLRFHELGPRGGARRLERRGLFRRISDPDQVTLARTEPPADTRAFARGQAIKFAHANAVSGRAAWDRVRVGKLGYRYMGDPLDSGSEGSRRG